MEVWIEWRRMENGPEMFRSMKQKVKIKIKRMEGMNKKSRNENRCEAGSPILNALCQTWVFQK